MMAHVCGYQQLKITQTYNMFIPFAFNKSTPASLSSFMNATGGTITYDGNFKIHTFTSDSNFIVTVGGTAQVLVVGPGGGGNYGGGGGGKVNYNAAMSIPAATYPVVYGAAAYPVGTTASFNGVTSAPGQMSGDNGGAAGGGNAGGLGSTNIPGGNSNSGRGGGGGNAANGSNGQIYVSCGAGDGAGGAGGAGTSNSITGTALIYGGGGGGRKNGCSAVNGADGGNTYGLGQNGVNVGSAGSSGVVIIRYQFQ